MHPTKTVDWEAQWALFAPNFRDGLAHIALREGLTLRLAPGAGFGDLSHPTTRLCLALLQEQALGGAHLIDIGCGSGILSLAAALLGAASVVGIDIAPEALRHAQLNQKINRAKRVRFAPRIPKNFRPNLLLMNMIRSEQRIAWRYHFPGALLIASGILAQERTAYLALSASWGWTPLAEREEQGWLAFLFRV